MSNVISPEIPFKEKGNWYGRNFGLPLHYLAGHLATATQANRVHNSPLLLFPVNIKAGFTSVVLLSPFPTSVQ